jgi:hypothetical protein
MKLVLYMPFRELDLPQQSSTDVWCGANLRRVDRNFLRSMVTGFTLSVIMTTGIAFTQDESAQALAD